MLFYDAPAHTRLRKVMNAGFTSLAIETMALRIQSIVDALLDKLEKADTVDFIRDFAHPLPASVTAAMLGIDERDCADFMAWSDDIAAFIGSPTASLQTLHAKLKRV